MNSERVLSFIKGTSATMALTIASIAIGVSFALVLAFMRMSKNGALRGVAWAYIWIFRGTPLLLQIFAVNMMFPILIRSIFGVTLKMDLFASGVAALALNTAAYCAEIIRSGIESIDKGQLEASQALGMGRGLAMRKVIIPQTFKRIIPPFSNEFTMILKDSSLVSAIGYTEMLRVARNFANSGAYEYFLLAAGIYLALTTISSVIFDRLEAYCGRYL
jgi:polar amino acid transport system permease protein